jgi:hypothetical protein
MPDGNLSGNNIDTSKWLPARPVERHTKRHNVNGTTILDGMMSFRAWHDIMYKVLLDNLPRKFVCRFLTHETHATTDFDLTNENIGGIMMASAVNRADVNCNAIEGKFGCHVCSSFQYFHLVVSISYLYSLASTLLNFYSIFLLVRRIFLPTSEPLEYAE